MEWLKAPRTPRSDSRQVYRTTEPARTAADV
jgi:hypothetical protein